MARLARAVRAAVHRRAGLVSVADDRAAAVVASRRDRVDRALEGVERAWRAARDADLHSPVVLVPADLAGRHDHRLRSSDQLDFLPPLRPAACFCARLPPLPLPLLRLLWLLPLPLPERFPPLLEAPGELEIAAARDLLIPFFRSPSYCLSSFTLDPWSLAMPMLLSLPSGRCTYGWPTRHVG